MTIEQYKIYHKLDGKYGDGQMILSYYNQIKGLIDDTKSQSLLDFGCGKAKIYKRVNLAEKFGVMPDLYDPAIEEYSELPNKQYDGVFCCDVMEHIPEIEVPGVIEQIYERANKFVFFAIATDPAMAVLPNGENAHCTTKPIQWWEEIINKNAPKKVYSHVLLTGKFENYSILNEELYLESLF